MPKGSDRPSNALSFASRTKRLAGAAALAAVTAMLLSACAGQIAPPSPPATPAPTTVLHQVLAVYPSAELPPISSPYLFYWDFGTPPYFPGAVADAQGAGDAQQQALAAKLHRLSVFWTFGPQWPYGHTKQAFIDFYRSSIRPYQASLIDEWQDPQGDAPTGSPLSAKDPFGIEGAIEGIAAAKAESPGALVLVAWRGESSLLPLVKKNDVDYLLIEAYQNVSKSTPLEYGVSQLVVDLRIAKARSWGVIDRTVPWLGHFVPFDQYHRGHVLTIEELERQIRHYRKIAPEMPGLAFFGGNANPVLSKAASDLARKYFIGPAPEVIIRRPTNGATLTRSPHLIAAIATAKGGRSVAEYKGFIDNDLVYEGANPAFTWDFGGEAPGTHIITVQAIDSGWNRAAAQITVECQ